MSAMPLKSGAKADVAGGLGRANIGQGRGGAHFVSFNFHEWADLRNRVEPHEPP
jgi:hypothetical protein